MKMPRGISPYFFPTWILSMVLCNTKLAEKKVEQLPVWSSLSLHLLDYQLLFCSIFSGITMAGELRGKYLRKISWKPFWLISVQIVYILCKLLLYQMLNFFLFLAVALFLVVIDFVIIYKPNWSILRRIPIKVLPSRNTTRSFSGK